MIFRHPIYLQVLRQYVGGAYKADLGKGDVTTKWFLPQSRQMVRAKVIAGESGILAGVLEARWFLKRLGVGTIVKKREGQPVRRGETLLVLSGRADRILQAERTLLNLLQRMSGVATATQRLASKLPRGIKLLATRKTLWGLLDKRAVVVGGGGPHRLGLDDAVLIKDNHLALTRDLRLNWKRVMAKAKNVKFIEIELDSLRAVKKFMAINSFVISSGRSIPIIVMLDNFKPAQVRAALKLLKPLPVKIEVSGGITEKNIERYAIPGVHFISSGAITNKAPSIDMSLAVISNAS